MFKVNRKSSTVPAIMNGAQVGTVTTSKTPAGRVRHVATDLAGHRVGTFDSFTQARTALAGIKVTDANGKEIHEGAEVTSFRGEVAIFKYVSRRSSSGSWRVVVDDHWGSGPHEYNAEVYYLTVK